MSVVFPIAAGTLLSVLAFVLRVAVHWRRTPGGVDTWYYMAYADAFRRRPSLDVRLPQYLLQDEHQSYPPLFPSLLGLVPRQLRLRFYWAIAPAIDAAHALLLYVVCLRLTESLAVACIAAGLYAFTPHLVAETRSLNPRPFGALMLSLALLFTFRSLTPGAGHADLAGAIVAATAVLLASAAMSAAYALASAALALSFGEPRYALFPAAALLLALFLTGGRYLRVVRNYVHAVDYWRRNRSRFGAHPVLDSPLYGSQGRAPAQRPGFLGQDRAQELLRLLGEAPILLALPLAPVASMPWAPHLYAWAVSLVALAVTATLVPPLRAFGPGRSYMKAALFPLAFTLAAGIGGRHGLFRPLGAVSIASLLLSLGAIAFFWRYVRARPSEQTASVPPDLERAVERLRDLPEQGALFCLPYMYMDYVGYHSGRAVVWGGHCGDLRRFERVAPVLRYSLSELFHDFGARFLLIDTGYLDPSRLRLDADWPVAGSFGSFRLYRWRRSSGQTVLAEPQLEGQ